MSLTTAPKAMAGPLHYRDTQFDTQAVKLLPADYMVTDRDIALVTVLGSCVAACLRDPQAGLGGMNHFMLPDAAEVGGAPARYGSYAMELLINAMLKAGARRDRIEAKVFGGGNVLKSFTATPVGTRNAEFIENYLRTERIPLIAHDLLGIHPRKVWFFPKTGRVVVRKLPHAHEQDVVREERTYRADINQHAPKGSVELFD